MISNSIIYIFILSVITTVFAYLKLNNKMPKYLPTWVIIFLFSFMLSKFGLFRYLPIKYASDMLHVNEHIFSYEKMKLYSKFEYKFVEDIKFVNIKKFFKENGIRVGKNSIVQLGKIKDLELDASATFYKLKDDYAIVVYE